MALPDSVKGERKKNQYLIPTLFDLYDLLQPILSNINILDSFENQVKKVLQDLKISLIEARNYARTKRHNTFFSKFIQLKGADRDRKFLQKGRLPEDEAKRTCLGCGHCAVDEPDSNDKAISNNAAGLLLHEQKKAEDEAAWANGQAVRNSKGEVMKKGRSRPFKMEVVRQECHCEQFGCTSRTGEVPSSECPLMCIDEATGERYGFDENGNCLCPICNCTCRLAWDVSL